MSRTLRELRQEAIELQKSGEQDRAARAYARYLSMNPTDAGAWSNLGVLHRSEGRHEMALRAQTRAVQISPDQPALMNNLANILSDLGRYDDSIRLRKRILELEPKSNSQHTMIGRCLRGKGDYSAAITYMEQASEQLPDDADLRLQLAFAYLGAGDYLKGFAAYAARWQTGDLTPRSLAFPEWRGEDLRGKSVTVFPEQGYGDAVLFMRFLPILKKLGAYVRVAAEKPMLRLFSELQGADEVVPMTPEVPRSDFWVNMVDLASPTLANTAEIPAPASLHIPDDSVRRAQRIAAPFADRFKVGVVWTGSATYKGNAFRSFTHQEFLPLTDIPRVQLFSLYKGPFLSDYYRDGADTVMVDVGSSDADFADCAAMMRELDLVITSDTATAHIAGSLGIPTWVVLHWDPFWVWTHHGSATPWYPSIRLFRQEVPLNWQGVLREVEVALRELVKGDVNE